MIKNLTIHKAPTPFSKACALNVAEQLNNKDEHDDCVYVVRLFNEEQKIYVIDVVDSGEVVFTL